MTISFYQTCQTRPRSNGFARFLLAAVLVLAIPSLSAQLQGQPSPTVAPPAELQTKTIRVAAISLVPVKFDLPGNARRLEAQFRRAQAGGAHLAVAPEGALDGYVVNEIIAGEVPAERILQVAVALDDPVIHRFQELAAELKLCLIFGLAERVGEEVFNCAVCIDRDGSIAGKYHKMQLAEGYHPSWWFNRLGQRSRAFDTSLGRCGILICNDRWNPQLAQIPVLDGAQFLVIPAYGSRSLSQDQAVLARSRENAVPIVEANVGVTLVTDGQQILAVDRHEEGITFAEVPLATPPKIDAGGRDAIEQEFLTWRAAEMCSRYEQTLRKLAQKTDDSKDDVSQNNVLSNQDH